MKTSPAGLLFLAKWEGEVDRAYYDVAHVLTIGIGHAVRPGDGFTPSSTITHQEALDLLAHDVAWAELTVNHLVTVPMTQNQFDALVDFTFNCGGGAFASSQVLALLNAGNGTGAAAHLLDFDHCRKNGQLVEDMGLKRRRVTEQNLFLTPDAPPPFFPDDGDPVTKDPPPPDTKAAP